MMASDGENGIKTDENKTDCWNVFWNDKSRDAENDEEEQTDAARERYEEKRRRKEKMRVK